MGVILCGTGISISCSGLFKKEEERRPIARVGDSYLYKEDLEPLLNEVVTKEDSAVLVTNYINNWATRQLLFSKAKINLSQEKLAEFDALVADYRTDLYTRAYKEALVEQGSDTAVTEAQLERFYDQDKDNFRLREKLVSLRFVELPKQFINREEVAQRLRRYNAQDAIFLDSIGVQFKKLHLNDSTWVTVTRVIEEIPPLNFDNQDRYLKKSQFFELEDSLGVYLGKVNEVLQINDVAPLSFIKPTIKQVLLNRRRLDYIRKLETDIIDEAIKKKDFEVY